MRDAGVYNVLPRAFRIAGSQVPMDPKKPSSRERDDRVGQVKRRWRAITDDVLLGKWYIASRRAVLLLELLLLLVAVGTFYPGSLILDGTYPSRHGGPPIVGDNHTHQGSQPSPSTRRSRYEAVLTLASDGAWSGDERFILSATEARGLAREGSGALADRLQAKLPTGWIARKEYDQGQPRYLLMHRYEAPKVEFHDVWPLTDQTELPPPSLLLLGRESVLYAAEGSTISVTAPSARLAPEPFRRARPRRTENGRRGWSGCKCSDPRRSLGRAPGRQPSWHVALAEPLWARAGGDLLAFLLAVGVTARGIRVS